MKKSLIIGGLALIICIGAALALPLLMRAQMPAVMEKKIAGAFRTAGFTHFNVRRVTIHGDKIVFKNISLDKEGFSKIADLKVSWSVLDVLPGRLPSTLEITGLRLTGEENEDGTLTMAGWRPPGGPLYPASFFKEVSIEDGVLDLLSQRFGGLHFDYEGKISRGLTGTLKLFLDLKTKQKLLAFNANVTGELEKNGLWNSTIDLDQGRVSTDELKVTRITGQAMLEGRANAPAAINAQFTAGGVTLYDSPWQQVNASIFGTTADYKLFAEGKSVGAEGLEFSLTRAFRQGRTYTNAALHAENLGMILDYLATHGIAPLKPETRPALAALKNITLEIAGFPGGEDAAKTNLIYRIKNGNEVLDIKGETKNMNVEESPLSGTLSMQPVRLADLENSLREEGESPLFFKNGTILASGRFRMPAPDQARLKKTKEERQALPAFPEGTVTLDVQNAAFIHGGLRFHDISGSLKLEDLPALATTEDQSVNFHLALNPDIPHTGRAMIGIENGFISTINNIAVDIFNGKIEVKTVKVEEPAGTFYANIENLDLAALGNALAVDHLAMNGKLKGTLPLSSRENGLYIENAVLTSEGKGTIRFDPPQTPPFLRGSDMKFETIRMALENFNYDFFEIRLNGPLSGTVKTVIAARGTNPGMFGNRPIELNLSLEEPLMPLFRNMTAAQEELSPDSPAN